MKKQKASLIIIMVFVLSVCSFSGGSFAIPGIHSVAPSIPPAGKTVPPVPPRVPAYIYKWSIAHVINTLRAHGLDIKGTEPLSKQDYKPLPSRGKEAIKFKAPALGEDGKGCIFSFERESDMGKIKNYYAGLNESGELYSWSFQKDNILIVIAGRISEGSAKKFESALNTISK